MKKFLIVPLAVLFLAALLTQGASAAVGLKGGLALSNFTYSGEASPLPLTNLTAPVGGIFFNLGLGLVSIQPEILYVRMGTHMEVSPDWAEDRFDYVQVPILLKVNLMPGPVRPMIFAGPYGSYLLAAKEVDYVGGVTESVDIKDQVKSTDYGIVFGGGLDFHLGLIKLSAEARYNLGLANIEANPLPGTSIKNKSLMFMAGIAF
jgi:hypothetical protein